MQLRQQLSAFLARSSVKQTRAKSALLCYWI